MRIELRKAIGDLAMRSGQEARAHAPGARAEPQIEACGLDLPVEKRTLGRDRAFCDERLDLMSGENAATLFMARPFRLGAPRSSAGVSPADRLQRLIAS